jgi:hypothetical protein
MARLIETDSFTNKDISAAVAIGAYTANATRLVHVRVALDQVAGNGDYIIYATLQIAGTGSSYRIIPITTAAAASGVTALMFVSQGIPMDNTDVLTVYIDGLAGDTTTPDTRVDFYEKDYLRPTVSGRTLDVSATGEAGIDLTNKLDTTGILPTAAAGAVNGLPILSAALTTSANVTLWKGDTPGDLDVDGNVPTASSGGGATADDLWDEVVDGTYTARQLLRLLASALAAKSSGGGTTVVTFRDVADTKDRIVATVDAGGNRTAVTLTAT